MGSNSCRREHSTSKRSKLRKSQETGGHSAAGMGNPLTADNYPLQPGVGKSYLSQAERAKVSKEGPLCAAVSWGFHPVAVSPWGGLGPQARWLLDETTKQITTDLPMAAHTVRVGEVRQNLSLTLAREVARQLSVRWRIMDAR